MSPFSEQAVNLNTFFWLYLAQAIPMSFFSTAIQVLMREADYSLSTIALLQLIKLPWILKFLWAPLIDRRCITLKAYKRCIVTSEIVYAILILLVGLLPIESHLYLITGLIALSLIASATQDIATDSLAVLSVGAEDKSLVNSMQSMGSFGGTLVGGGVLLLVLQRYGWQTVTPCLSLFVLLALIPLLRNKQMHMAPKERAKRAKLTDFYRFFLRRSIWKQIGFLLLYYAGIIGILSVLRSYLVDLGYSLMEIGLLMGIAGTGTAFLSSFLAGLLVRKIGLYRSRILFALFILFTTIYFLCLFRGVPSTPLLYLGTMLLWSSYGMATIVVYTTAMNCVRNGCEGTDFTIQTVLTHLSGIGMAFLAGVVADRSGYLGLSLFELLLASLSVIYCCCCFRQEPQQNHP